MIMFSFSATFTASVSRVSSHSFKKSASLFHCGKWYADVLVVGFVVAGLLVKGRSTTGQANLPSAEPLKSDAFFGGDLSVCMCVC